MRNVPVIALFVLISANVFAAPPPSIRVLVIEKVPAVTVKNAAGTKRDMRVMAERNGLSVNGAGSGTELEFASGRNFLDIDGRHFRDTVKIIWNGDRDLSIINLLPLEDYLTGLINSEIRSDWPFESVKAQAVAARSYALNLIENKKRSTTEHSYDVKSTVMDQVYDGAHLEDEPSKRAVNRTSGEVLTKNGRLFAAYYHSCCGGRTEHAHNVWAGEEGPPIVSDRYCVRSPKFSWDFKISIAEFVRALQNAGISIGNLSSVAKSILSDSPRTGEMLIEDENGMKMIKATELRRIFGYQNIKSTWFDVVQKGKELIFTGRGYGHGVGMCQWGAKAMAEENRTYNEILKFYYPDAEISKVY